MFLRLLGHPVFFSLDDGFIRQRVHYVLYSNPIKLYLENFVTWKFLPSKSFLKMRVVFIKFGSWFQNSSNHLSDSSVVHHTLNHTLSNHTLCQFRSVGIRLHLYASTGAHSFGVPAHVILCSGATDEWVILNRIWNLLLEKNDCWSCNMTRKAWFILRLRPRQYIDDYESNWLWFC